VGGGVRGGDLKNILEKGNGIYHDSKFSSNKGYFSEQGKYSNFII